MTRGLEHTAGLVLAGGRSSRMGRDKALLPWRGRSLLDHAQQVLRDAGVRRVIVSGEYPGCEAVADRAPGLGPLGGLASAVDLLPDGPLLVVPVDMPRLSTALLRYLAINSRASCACFHDQPLPLWLRLDPAARAVLAQLLAGPSHGRSLRGLHAALRGETLQAPARWSSQLRDADTPEDWQALSA